MYDVPLKAYHCLNVVITNDNSQLNVVLIVGEKPASVLTFNYYYSFSSVTHTHWFCSHTSLVQRHTFPDEKLYYGMEDGFDPKYNQISRVQGQPEI